jgi:poly-gamma-glutamate capsule biosynthesis protein CapA/YwtB (metallophosphatase superfamily)
VDLLLRWGASPNASAERVATQFDSGASRLAAVVAALKGLDLRSIDAGVEASFAIRAAFRALLGAATVALGIQSGVARFYAASEGCQWPGASRRAL